MADADMLPQGDGDFVVNPTLTLSAVRSHILDTLGRGLFKVELNNQQLDSALRSALQKYGKRLPVREWFTFPITPGVTSYDLPAECKLAIGIYDVSFIDMSMNPASLYYYNLLNPAPLKPQMLADVEIFYRWRAQFSKTLSIDPHWEHDALNNRLLISNPAIAFNACVIYHRFPKLSEVRQNHQDWILEYSVAKARAVLADVRGKFSGAIPGAGRDLTLNADAMRADAKEEMQRLEDVLLGWQGDTPISFI